MIRNAKRKGAEADTPDLRQETEDFRKEVLEEFKSLKGSMQHCSDFCDDAVQLTKDVKVLMKKVKELTTGKQELKWENRRLAQRVNEFEQYSRANNLEIKSVPVDADADEVVL